MRSLSSSSSSLLVLFVVVLALGVGERAPGESLTTITSLGEGNADSLPDHITFRLVRTIEGDTMEATIERAIEFEAVLRERLQAHDLSPAPLRVSDPIGRFSEPEQGQEQGRAITVVEATARFHIPRRAERSYALRELARIYDGVRTVADTLNFAVHGPALGLNDPDALLEEAVGQAMEDAFPPAQAAAQSLRGRIDAVLSVELEAIDWTGTDHAPRADTPYPTRIGCRVKARVTYIVGGSG